MSLIKGTGGECGGDPCPCEKDCSGSQPECGGAITCADSGCFSEGCNCPETYCDSSVENRNFSCEIKTVVCFSDGCRADSCLVDNCPEYCANYEGNKYPCGGVASFCTQLNENCICSASCGCGSYCSLGDLPCSPEGFPDCNDECGCWGNAGCEGIIYKEGTCDCIIPNCDCGCGYTLPDCFSHCSITHACPCFPVIIPPPEGECYCVANCLRENCQDCTVTPWSCTCSKKFENRCACETYQLCSNVDYLLPDCGGECESGCSCGTDCPCCTYCLQGVIGSCACLMCGCCPTCVVTPTPPGY